MKKILLTIALLIAGIMLYGNEASDQQDKSRVRVGLDYYVYDNAFYELEAELKTKVGRVYEKVPGIVIEFYIDSISQGTLLGLDTSDQKGFARLKLPAGAIDKKAHRTYFAVLNDHPRFRDEETSIEIQYARLEVAFHEGDSLNELITSVITVDSSLSNVPASEVPIRIFVDRSFGMLSLNEMFEMTNDEGTYSFVFPDDIPGDSEGNVEIIVKVSDHFLFGNLIDKNTKQWGVPVQSEDILTKRELWSARANAPIYLIAVANSIILGIWSILIYILYQLFKIKRMGAAD